MSENIGDASPLSEQQQLVDELIFKRDVNEGFLLIDYISGRSEKSLKDLDIEKLEIPGLSNLGDGTPAASTQAVSTSEVWRRFCQIGYPPVSESRVKAENAAFVLEVKDRLNALARPARGVTIAYTAIFISSLWLQRKYKKSQHTLADQAEDAYPSIAPHARRFAWVFGAALPLFLLLWFLLTAVTYWDIGYGGSIVQTLQQLDTQRTALLQPGGHGSAASTVPETCKSLASSGPGAQARADECAKLARLDDDMRGARANLREFREWVTRELHFWDLVAYLRPIRWGFLAYNPQLSENTPEQSVTWVLTLFGSYVLPAMFGLLGTMAAVVRVVLSKVRDNLLSPRDLSLSALGLLIGPLAGLAVGLFYMPSPAASAQGTAGLAGTVTLTVSGIGFLAGYGADAFFKFLDALLVRVFALDK